MYTSFRAVNCSAPAVSKTSNWKKIKWVQNGLVNPRIWTHLRRYTINFHETPVLLCRTSVRERSALDIKSSYPLWLDHNSRERHPEWIARSAQTFLRLQLYVRIPKAVPCVVEVNDSPPRTTTLNSRICEAEMPSQCRQRACPAAFAIRKFFRDDERMDCYHMTIYTPSGSERTCGRPDQ
jgi:hypothetical protein